MRDVRSLGLALLLCCLALPARAQQPPTCTAPREGLEICMAEKLCRCRYVAGGSLTGRPSGLSWDCGILRPSCGIVPAAPRNEAPPWMR